MWVGLWQPVQVLGGPKEVGGPGKNVCVPGKWKSFRVELSGVAVPACGLFVPPVACAVSINASCSAALMSLWWIALLADAVSPAASVFSGVSRANKIPVNITIA